MSAFKPAAAVWTSAMVSVPPLAALAVPPGVVWAPVLIVLAAPRLRRRS